MTDTAKRLLWISNDPDSPGGYGVATAEFAPRIKRAGVDIAIYQFWGGKQSPTTWGDEQIVVLPPTRPGAISDIALAHARFHETDIAVSLVDPLALPAKALSRLFWCAWTPSDSEPVALANRTALQYAKLVWSMSKHGHEQLKLAGYDPIYVPLSVNTTVFKPQDRTAGRELLVNTLHQERDNDHVALTDDTFLIVMNSANLSRPCRKGFWEAIEAFKRFREKHPDSALYIHTDRHGVQGEPIHAWIDLVGLEPEDVWTPPTYYYMTGLIGQDWLSYMYSAADVFLQPSYGEGFGLPIVEAQACGTPVIVTDFSSMPELTFAGWKVPGTLTPALNPGCLHRRPVIDKLVEALETAYSERQNQTLREQARAGALAYDTDVVFDRYMRPALAKLFEAADAWRTAKAVTVDKPETTPEPEPETKTDPEAKAEESVAAAD